MDILRLDLGSVHGIIIVHIHKKTIKNVHLKVSRDLKINISVPLNVTDEWINKFVLSRKNWISTQLFKYKQSSGHNSLLNLKNGMSTQFIGKDMRIFKKESLVEGVEVIEKSIVIHLIELDNEVQFNKIFSKFWRQQAGNIFEKEMTVIFNNIFKKYKLEKPKLIIKKMKTLWGSCTKSKNKVTLNEYLLKADIRCIQYVILHELTHLIYTYHNEDFYNFLTIHMPDWKERKKQLDIEVAQGL